VILLLQELLQVGISKDNNLTDNLQKDMESFILEVFVLEVSLWH
jgi:hypothetical protein